MADTGNSLIYFSDVVIATCTLLGPVLAVQAQKWVERFREKQQRRLTIISHTDGDPRSQPEFAARRGDQRSADRFL